MKNFDNPPAHPHVPYEAYGTYDTQPDNLSAGAYDVADDYTDTDILRPQEMPQGSEAIITPDNPLRIEDTPIGPVTVIRQDTSLLPYSAADMVELLTTSNPKKLDTPPQTKSDHRHPIGYIPDREDVLVRWVGDDRKQYLPATPERVAAHMHEFEQHVDHLRALGMRMLPRNVIIVEHDEHFDGRPNVYTATQRLHDPGNLWLPSKRKATREELLRTCGIIDIVYDYLDGLQHGDPIIHDGLYHPGQYAADGTWLDYDPYISRETYYKSQSRRLLYNWERNLNS